VKLFVATRALAARAARRDLYERGDYVPIQAFGARSDCLFAFARGTAITCVPRLVATLSPDGRPPLGPAAWGDTWIGVADGASVRDVFTGAVLTPVRGENGYALPASEIFARFPVALLLPIGSLERPGDCSAPALPDAPAPTDPPV
jgi:(1->4)-alpha-D-glucan 1-alpha-D-glucosylmutase